MSNAATTVDSLINFSKQNKKKFSFANKSPIKKNNSYSTEVTNTDSGTQSDDDAETASAEQLDTSDLVKKSSWKGSARLKQEKSSHSSSESEDDEEAKLERKKKKKLSRLKKMFPDLSTDLIKKKFAESEFNAKKCVDILLKEKQLAKEKLLDEENEKIDKKRKTNENDDSFNNGPLKKKARKLVLDSDDDENGDETDSVTKQNSIASSNSNSAKTSTSSLSSKATEQSSSTAEVKQVKQNKKKLIIKSSSDEDQEQEQEQEEKKKKSKKKSNKDKTKKKKTSYSDNEFVDEADDGDDFNKSDASGGDDSDDDGDNLSEAQQVAILSLFNDAPLLDIQSMINISTKKLETLLSLRPFENFKDLRTKLAQKSLIAVIDSAKDIIYARSIVSNLLSKCEKISEKMEKQVFCLINEENGSSVESTLEIKSQPQILNKNLSLKPYQLIGLNWLCLMHKEKINAILADEMGLGKTCQTISFLAHLYETNKKLMHLIIVPPSTLDNWVREISTWCPDFNFTVYQGNLEERRHLRYDIINNKFEKPLNAILTTYGLISSTNEDKAFFKKLKVEYCVFDEAHMLKNMNSIRYQALIKIQSKRKLLLTGTPLQNNLVELMSLLYFTMPDVFQNRTQYVNKIFSAKPSNVDVDTFYTEKISQAKGIMKPFILRRLKTEVLKQLPQKIEEIIHCDMSTRQEQEYNNLIAYYKKRKDELLLEQAEKANMEKNKKLKAATGATNVPSKMDEILEIMNSAANLPNKNKNEKKETTSDSSSNILMELRKAANHPLLRRVLYDNDKLKQMAKLIMKESPPDTNYAYVLEDLSVMSDFQLHKLCPLYRCLKGFELKEQDIVSSGKFTVLDSLLQEKKESNDRVLIFSQFVIMLDIVEEFLKIKKFKYFRLDGATAISERQDMIDEYNNDKEIFIFLLSTKAGGVGINLTAANVVVLHDIDFNPFNDKQAEDRCHRVGQTKEVQVFKLISKNSIDETMLKIQKRKLELGADISGENDESEAKSDMVSMLKEALKL